MPMKIPAPLFLLMAGILVSGCASHKQKPPAPAPKASTTIITPDASLAGKVVSYNSTGRFVVLSFPVGQMPVMNQTLFLYRAGLKVGEVKDNGLPLPNYNLIVADLINGDAQVGDEARDQ